MRTHELSPSIYEYVRGVYKGKGLGLGKIASEARSFEFDLNCWNDELNRREAREDGR